MWGSVIRTLLERSRVEFLFGEGSGWLMVDGFRICRKSSFRESSKVAVVGIRQKLPDLGKVNGTDLGVALVGVEPGFGLIV